MKSIKKFLLSILGIFMISTVFSSCGVLDAVKDRYIPYELVGVQESEVLVKFVFDAPSATEVWLAGSFNNWSQSKSNPAYPAVPLAQNARVVMSLDPKTGYWVATIPLAPGRYQYKYIVDTSNWQEDPNTPEHVDDGFGGNNSIVMVTMPSGEKEAPEEKAPEPVQ